MKLVDWVKGWHLASVAIVTAIVAVGLFALLRDEPLQTDEIERDIRDDMAGQLGVDRAELRVDCPSTVDWDANEEFNCVAEDSQGTRATVTVSMDNDEEYTWVVR